MPFCQLQLDESHTLVTCKICGEPFPVTIDELLLFNFDVTKFDQECLVKSDPSQVVHPILQRPPLWRRTINFLRAWTVHLWKGNPRVSKRKAQKRLAICVSCPVGLYFDGYCTHASCGCPVSDRNTYFSKLYWRDGKCPVGYW